MTFNELSPTIQSWIDSDEFINSVVSVVKEFNLPSSAPLISLIIDLSLKTIRPEELKTKLLASFPPEKQNEGLVTRLVNLSLLPIKEPLAESGIDISVIAPLDEVISSYSPNAKQPEEQNELDEISLIDGQEEITETYPPLIAEIPPTSALVSSAEPILASIEQPRPTFDESIPLIPNFDASTSVPATPPSTSESMPAPFIIHQEKTIPQVSINSHKESLIRPMFYSGEREVKENAPIASIEFGETKDAKKINPANIVDLNNLSS